MVGALRAQGWQGTLAGTRKTTPGFRLVEKYGMLAGGADPHRHDLSSMTMLKDNHVWACANNRAAADGGVADPSSIESIAAAIPRAVQAAKATGGFSTKVEVECRSVEEANAAIGAGADIIMLDQHLQHLDPIHLPPNLLFTMASAHGDLRHLLPGNYKRVITSWLEEDCPSLDYGGFVVGESEGEARLLGKSKVNQRSL